MTMVDTDSLPPEPPPTADPGGVPMPSQPPRWNPSVDIAALSRGGLPAPAASPTVTPLLPPGVDINRLSQEAAAIQREKAAATQKVNAETVAQLGKDRQRLEQQYNASGIGPDDLKPWDADAAREKFKYDPIEAFGSIGSVFAIVASAFTNRPMENAMFGAAAAMGAIKEGNALEHERAYKAWQDNTKLAIDRQKIQSQQFTNAVTLFNTDMTLGKERASLFATQYDDKQMSLLLDNGLYKEAIELNEKRQSMSIKLAEVLPKLALDNIKTGDLLGRGYDPRNPNSMESRQALQGWQRDWNRANITADEKFMAAVEAEYDQSKHGPYSEYIQKRWAAYRRDTVQTTGVETPQKVALTKFLEANPEATPAEISTFLRNLKGASDTKVAQDDRRLDISALRADEILRHNQAMEAIVGNREDTARLRAEETARHNRAMEGITANRGTGGQQAQEIERRTREIMDKENLDRTAAYNKAAAEVKAANSAQTVERALLPAIEARTKELEAEGVKPAEARTQATREVKTSSAAPSGNRLDDIKGMTDRVTLAESVIDKIDNLLLKHNAITGMGGTLTRPIEIVGNILGSNETDRVQFARYIAELKEVLPRIITGSNARPLAAEVGDINRIAAGMSLGDTGANTVRAYAELRPLLLQIKRKLQERGTGLPGSAPPAAAAPAQAPSWQSAPVQ